MVHKAKEQLRTYTAGVRTYVTTPELARPQILDMTRAYVFQSDVRETDVLFKIYGSYMAWQAFVRTYTAGYKSYVLTFKDI